MQVGFTKLHESDSNQEIFINLSNVRTVRNVGEGRTVIDVDGFLCQVIETAEDVVNGDRNIQTELLDSLIEMREACAAAMRVIVSEPKLMDQFDVERKGIPDGFGVRADEVIARAKEKKR